MASNNPAYTRIPAFTSQGAVATTNNMSAQQLDEIYQRSSAPVEGETMTVEDTIAKTVGLFAVLLVGAGIGWITAPALPFLWIGAG